MPRKMCIRLHIPGKNKHESSRVCSYPSFISKAVVSADFAEGLLHFLVLIRRNRDYPYPDVPVCCWGRHPMFESLNSDRIIRPGQTVTRAVKLHELTVVEQRAKI